MASQMFESQKSQLEASFRETYEAKFGEWKATTLAQVIEENRAYAFFPRRTRHSGSLVTLCDLSTATIGLITQAQLISVACQSRRNKRRLAMSRNRITKTVRIRAPVEEVFKVITDPENALRLNLAPNGSFLTTNRVERITKDPIGMGSVWHFEGSLGGVPVKWDEQVVEWRPPWRLVTRQIGGPFKGIRWEHSLVPVKSGTKETHTLEYEPLGSLDRPLDRREFKRQMSEGMDAAIAKLKSFLETKAGQDGDKKLGDLQ